MIRVALVGCGGVATGYRRAYSKIEGVEWTLAMDVNPASLQECRAEGARRVSTNFADALAPDIDVIDIWTPNHLHEEQACAALAAGKHVLLQKPITPTLEAADHLLAVARQCKRTVGMYMTMYNSPIHWELRKLIASGALGNIQLVRSRDAYHLDQHIQPNPNNWRASLEKTGGGSFLQLSIHSINLVQWWLGASITEVMAYSANQYSRDLVGGDDNTAACVRFGQDDRAVLGVFESAYASDAYAREVYGTRGFFKLPRLGPLELTLDQPYSSPLIQYSQPGTLQRFEFSDPCDDDGAHPCNQHRMYFEALAQGKSPHMTADTGRHDLAVCVAAYQSSRERRAIRVDGTGPG